MQENCSFVYIDRNSIGSIMRVLLAWAWSCGLSYWFNLFDPDSTSDPIQYEFCQRMFFKLNDIIRHSSMWIFVRYYCADVMYFLLSLSVSLHLQLLSHDNNGQTSE